VPHDAVPMPYRDVTERLPERKGWSKGRPARPLPSRPSRQTPRGAAPRREPQWTGVGKVDIRYTSRVLVGLPGAPRGCERVRVPCHQAGGALQPGQRLPGVRWWGTALI
jgi:hypothetical protein